MSLISLTILKRSVNLEVGIILNFLLNGQDYFMINGTSLYLFTLSKKALGKMNISYFLNRGRKFYNYFNSKSLKKLLGLLNLTKKKERS